MVCSLVVDLDHFVEIQLQLLIVYHIRILAIIWFFSLQFYAINAKKRIHISGYGMGGYMGMCLVKHYPGRINKLITLGNKFYWDEPVAAIEIPRMNAGLIVQKLPSFAKQLRQRYMPQDWELVLEKTKELLLNLEKQQCLSFK